MPLAPAKPGGDDAVALRPGVRSDHHDLREASTVPYATSAGSRKALLVGGSLLLLIGASGVIGWLTDHRVLTAIRPEFIPIAPNTALAFLLLGGSLCALTHPAPAALALARGAAALVFVIAAVTVGGHLIGADVGVDEWFIPAASPRLEEMPVGRMAFPTAITLSIACIALIVSTLPSRHRILGDISRALSLLVTIIGLLFLLGYGYGSPLLYGGSEIPMAVLTALAFVVLGSSIALPLILRDSAERSEARRALRAAHSDLERRVAERTAELAGANEGLRMSLTRLEEQTRTAEVATEAARMAEGRFRGLIEGLGVGVLLVGRDGIETANTAAARILGVAGAELRDRSLDDVFSEARQPDGSVFLPAQHPAALAFETGEPQRDVLMVLQRPGDAAVRIEMWAEPLFRPGHAKPYAVTLSFADVTARAALEEQLRQAQKMEGVGQLAGGIAHDFNNMLTAIKSFTELVLDELPAGAPHRSELLEVKDAADRAAALTRQLLAFSRRQLLQPVLLDLNGVVESSHKMLCRLIGPGIRCEARLDPALWTVRADPGQIEQVLVNLAVNAMDAMPNGGELVLATGNLLLDEQRARHIPELRPGEYVLLSVADTGVGMSDATRSRIFEPFFTTKQQGMGTGLGLAMVYGIVRQSGGHIVVESEPGRGTTFRIYLPRVEAEAGAGSRAAGTPTQASSNGTETILLVEDDAAVRQVADRILARHGYRVLQAPTPAEALAIFERESGRIDLVLTDIMLPRMSGRELADQLRGMQPSLPIVFMSGYTGDEVTTRNLLEAGTSFLPKPFTVEELTREVRSSLDAVASP